MATATLLASSVSLDNTSPPGIEVQNSLPYLLFDAATDEICYLEFRLPDNYASSPVLKAFYAMSSATSGDVVWAAEIWAMSDGDSADINTPSYDTANTVTDTVPATAGYPAELTITLSNNDSMAAGDLVRIKFYRDADNASDTATGDAGLRPTTITLEYTTV